MKYFIHHFILIPLSWPILLLAIISAFLLQSIDYLLEITE